MKGHVEPHTQAGQALARLWQRMGDTKTPRQKVGYGAQFCSPSAVSTFCENKAWLCSPASAFPSVEPGDFA